MSADLDSSYYENLQGLLRGLLITVDSRLEDDSVALIAELIDANECGVALEMISDLLVDGKVRIERSTRDAVGKLMELMDLPRQTLEQLESLVVEDRPSEFE